MIIRSPEWRLKQSIAQKARGSQPPSRKGIAHTESTKLLMSKTAKRVGSGKWMLGKKGSPESSHLKSINSARYWLGKKRPSLSEETKQKMSKSLMGHSVSKATRERMRNLNKNKFGVNHPCWTDEKKHPLYKAIREIFKYKDWRKSIFTRDNFTCVLCGIIKVYIEADHYPISFISIIKKNEIEDIGGAIKCEQLWDINNGRTLCKPCHLRTLTWGKKPRIKEL